MSDERTPINVNDSTTGPASGEQRVVVFISELLHDADSQLKELDATLDQLPEHPLDARQRVARLQSLIQDAEVVVRESTADSAHLRAPDIQPQIDQTARLSRETRETARAIEVANESRGVVTGLRLLAGLLVVGPPLFVGVAMTQGTVVLSPLLLLTFFAGIIASRLSSGSAAVWMQGWVIIFALVLLASCGLAILYLHHRAFMVKPLQASIRALFGLLALMVGTLALPTLNGSLEVSVDWGWLLTAEGSQITVSSAPLTVQAIAWISVALLLLVCLLRAPIKPDDDESI